jgi:protein-L-isoaspartate(D-aspartate) O-methyltransferase
VAYRDLWYAAGALTRRATHAVVPDQDQSRLALVDATGEGGAMILPDGGVLAGGPEASAYASLAVDVLDRWAALGRPSMRAWQVEFSLTGDPESPIWVPDAWEVGT